MNLLNEKKKIFEILEDVKRIYFDGIGSASSFTTVNKGENDLVTSLDLEIENYIIDKILKSFPKDNIISEETRNMGSIKDRNWVIDPIDGTCNLANGIPIYGVQIAFLNGTEPLLSAVLHPTMNELYYAEKGKGAYLNHERISVKKNISIKQAIISIGDFSKSNENARKVQLQIMTNINDKILKFRMWGSACFDLAYLAAGRTHAHIMFSRNMWDILPGILIAQEAGAVISGIDGSDYDIQKGVLLASSNVSIIDFIISEICEKDQDE